MDRRKFISYSALASASLLIPSFLKKTSASPFLRSASNQKILVVVQWSGGNDGLNTLIPYRNDEYYKARPRIAIPASESLKITDEYALHPSLTALQKLYEDSGLTILNGIGYPNPDRSHFRSMDIWQTAAGSDQYLNSGWIGRYLDAECKDCKQPYQAIEVDDTLSLAMKGELMNGLAVKDPLRLYKNTSEKLFRSLSDSKDTHVEEHNNVEYLYKTLRETAQSADYLYQQSRIYKTQEMYPNTGFGKDLKTIAELIIAGSSTRIYYISLSGFDTHINQNNNQSRVLGIYNDAIGSFVADLKKNDRWNDVMVMTFSEFGRRVEQNASGGTDHGKANCLFIAGGALKKPGVYNSIPDLTQLDQGDLQFSIDFRQVYATLLEKWLDADPVEILGEKFAIMPWC